MGVNHTDIPALAERIKENIARVVVGKEEMIDLLLRFKWWDKSIEEIDNLIPILTCSNLEIIRKELKKRL